MQSKKSDLQFKSFHVWLVRHSNPGIEIVLGQKTSHIRDEKQSISFYINLLLGITRFSFAINVPECSTQCAAVIGETVWQGLWRRAFQVVDWAAWRRRCDILLHYQAQPSGNGNFLLPSRSWPGPA